MHNFPNNNNFQFYFVVQRMILLMSNPNCKLIFFFCRGTINCVLKDGSIIVILTTQFQNKDIVLVTVLCFTISISYMYTWNKATLLFTFWEKFNLRCYFGQLWQHQAAVCQSYRTPGSRCLLAPCCGAYKSLLSIVVTAVCFGVNRILRIVKNESSAVLSYQITMQPSNS